MKVGDKVKVPFNQEGEIVKINEQMLWGFPYDVKITKATLNEVGEICEFKKEQLELI